jgi:predicted transposase YbfD/YdcC
MRNNLFKILIFSLLISSLALTAQATPGGRCAIQCFRENKRHIEGRRVYCLRYLYDMGRVFNDNFLREIQKDLKQEKQPCSMH